MWNRMLCFVIVVVLVAAPVFAENYAADQDGPSEEYDLDGDANIYHYIMNSLHELEIQRAQEIAHPEAVIQSASSVCYGELGCFDKDGTFKHLKQLPEPPETVNTHFLLYTRKNRQDPQMLDYKKPETILNSNIDPSKQLKIMTHGFGGRSNLTWLWNMKNALLEMHDVNIIIVDWSLGARTPYYIQASINTELVGAEIAVMYYFIKDKLGILEKDLHCIGFSLGGQVVGFVGKRMMALRGTRPARTTGLDPASPLFEDYGGEVHLYKDDADYVDVVHTNADLLLYGGIGMVKDIGHVDFYPNGGKRQPGCGSTIKGLFLDIFKGDRDRACNHERAVYLYIDTILTPDSCRFVGFKCANYTEFSKAHCLNCGDDCGHMGYNVKGTGIYYLMTKAKEPFCSDLVKVTVHFSNEGKKSFGAIIFTLVGPDNAKQNVTLTEKDEKLLPGSNRTLAISIEDGMLPLQSVEALYLRFNGWIAKGAKTFNLGSVIIEDTRGNHIFKNCEKSFILEDNVYKTLPSSC